MRAEQYHRLAELCAQRLEQAQDPRVRERLRREQRDWQELAERRSFAARDEPRETSTRH